MKNEELFKLASGGKDMKAMGMTPHRALDDAKAERYWLTGLPEFEKLFFGPEKALCSISLAAFSKYHKQ